jgi:hypothetical protein
MTLALDACSSGVEKGTATTVPPPSFSKQLAFMRNVVQDYPPARDQKMANVVHAAVHMCDALLNGATFREIETVQYKTSEPVQYDLALLVEGTHSFCPSEYDKMTKAVRAGGIVGSTGNTGNTENSGG